MATELPKLVMLDLYRNAVCTIEKMSRQKVHKKVHAWATRVKEEVSEMMMQVAEEEMYGEVEDSEEDKQKKADEEFYG